MDKMHHSDVPEMEVPTLRYITGFPYLKEERTLLKMLAHFAQIVTENTITELSISVNYIFYVVLCKHYLN